MARLRGVAAMCAGMSLFAQVRGLAPQEGVRTLQAVEAIKILGATEDISSNIPKITVARNGRIAFFDGPSAQFVFFDSIGKRIGVFGRAGQGPGEFTGGPIAFFYTGFVGDTLWAYETRARRFTLISPDLKLVRASALPVFDAATVGEFTPLALLAGNRLFGQVMIGKPVECLTATGDKRVWISPTDSSLVLATWDGKVEKRVADLPANTSGAVERDGCGGYSFATVPFATGPLRDVSQAGDRFVYVTHAVTTPTGGTYRVAVLGLNGDTIAKRSYAFTGEPVSKQVVDSILDRMASPPPGRGGRASQPMSAERLKFMREHIPSVEAPFSSVLLGIDGTIWLRNRASLRQPAEYLVLDENGGTFARVTLPRIGLTVQEASRSAIWAIERDADGFSNIIRFRLEPAK